MTSDLISSNGNSFCLRRRYFYNLSFCSSKFYGYQVLSSDDLTGDQSMPEKVGSESSAAVTVQNPTEDYSAVT